MRNFARRTAAPHSRQRVPERGMARGGRGVCHNNTQSDMNEKTSIRIFAEGDDGDLASLLNVDISSEIPILPTRNMVLFPGVLAPILIGRNSTRTLVKHLGKHHDAVFAIFCQKNADNDEPQQKDLYTHGVYAKLVRLLEMPGGNNFTAIVQGMGRCKLVRITHTRPYLKGMTIADRETLPEDNDREFNTAMEDLRGNSAEYVRMNDEMPDEAQLAFSNISNDVLAINFVCTNLPFSIADKMSMLSADTMKERVLITLKTLHKELQLLELKQNIRRKTRDDIDEQQREYFLQQQIKNIKEELGNGEGTSEYNELKKQAKRKKWPEEVKKAFGKELDKLDTYNSQSPEYSMQLNYLQTMIALPWNEYTKDNLDLGRARRVLDRDHYGMEKVKERILEFMAVLKLRGDLKSPIICLYGPPGVGKTSLGKSIAAAMNRKYVRMSLGGLHDESEIRGHRRTYIGAMPGRVIKGIQKAGSSNPVFVLDEIDKVTQATINGDPASALLEVLDPEQNSAFHDNYLDVDFDLSKVLFIATANDLGGIPRPLLDRMELIEVSGYTTEEKIEIAKRHLIPTEIKNTGLGERGSRKPQFSKAAVEKIIEQYTRESGVRQLEKQINKALRKLAFAKASDGKLENEKITPDQTEGLLGKPPFYRDIYQGNDYAGVVTGLAWTSVGGEILFIETSLSKGKTGKLTLTGNLGDVMKESAIIALEYVKAHIDRLRVDYRIFERWNVHIHVPEGATPKDGPSAGITIATSIASAITQRKVRKNTAMTGEITLRGKVLPVGGIKEKILAAKRAGITDIVLCKENRKDIEEIPADYLKGVSFHYVENVQDVWDFALTDEIVAHPVDFTIAEEKPEDKKEE